MFANNEYCTIETTNDLVRLGMETDSSVPTIYEAAKFLRENFHFNIYVTSISHESWQYHITMRKYFGKVGYGEDFYSYEDAMRWAIDEAINFANYL